MLESTLLGWIWVTSFSYRNVYLYPPVTVYIVTERINYSTVFLDYTLQIDIMETWKCKD